MAFTNYGYDPYGFGNNYFGANNSGTLEGMSMGQMSNTLNPNQGMSLGQMGQKIGATPSTDIRLSGNSPPTVSLSEPETGASFGAGSAKTLASLSEQIGKLEMGGINKDTPSTNFSDYSPYLGEDGKLDKQAMENDAAAKKRKETQKQLMTAGIGFGSRAISSANIGAQGDPGGRVYRPGFNMGNTAKLTAAGASAGPWGMAAGAVAGMGMDIWSFIKGGKQYKKDLYTANMVDFLKHRKTDLDRKDYTGYA